MVESALELLVKVFLIWSPRRSLLLLFAESLAVVVKRLQWG